MNLRAKVVDVGAITSNLWLRNPKGWFSNPRGWYRHEFGWKSHERGSDRTEFIAVEPKRLVFEPGTVSSSRFSSFRHRIHPTTTRRADFVTFARIAEL